MSGNSFKLIYIIAIIVVIAIVVTMGLFIYKEPMDFLKAQIFQNQKLVRLIAN